jgi:hypothetical protein
MLMFKLLLLYHENSKNRKELTLLGVKRWDDLNAR